MAAGSTSACATGGSSGCAAGDVDRVNHGRLGPKGLFGWQANNSRRSAAAPARAAGRRAARGELGRGDGARRRPHAGAAGDEGRGALGFYTSGQLFLEDYYTLALVARGGLGTNHLDGNTRLCTATAGQSLKETFGCDGQPAGVHDIEYCDTILHVGINTAETQTVLWMHELDRLRGPDPPRSIVIDPRETESAREAEVHLAIRPGTNLAVLNGLAQQLIENDSIDREFLEAHTVGFETLEKTVAAYTPERVAEICGVAPNDIRRAAAIVGEAERLLTFVLQGVYQSHQATASACAANNINLLRGMIGRPGAGILQMNGQPTAQNTRETGCNGDLPGFRNWQNEEHVAELARLWNVEPLQIPHWGPPTHAMEIFRYAEQGSIEFLWVSGTNPAVSLPELRRIRSILAQEGLFLVVSDAFLTETARLADVVLPTALWGEKTGTFTNADRTVHLSEQAVDPPGEARPDMEIFLDYARRLDLRDKRRRAAREVDDAGGVLRGVEGVHPRQALRLHRAQLREAPRRQRHPVALQRRRARTAPSGSTRTSVPDLARALRGLRPRPADRRDAPEDEFRALDAGRTRDPEGRRLDAAARMGAATSIRSRSRPAAPSTTSTRARRPAAPPSCKPPRPTPGSSSAPRTPSGSASPRATWCASRPRAARSRHRRALRDIREGVVFVPFHYGYWDAARRRPDGHPRAANELTMTIWDPVSKQPQLKTAAVKLERIG